MQNISKDTLKALAAANGLTISDDRLALVLRDYESLLRALDELNALPLARETEPATIFSLAVPSPSSNGRR